MERVDQDRGARVWGAIDAAARIDGALPSLRYAVSACADALSAVGAGLSMSPDGGPYEPLLATRPEVGELEELQFTLGQGPSADAIASGAPVLATDLSAMDAVKRWPAFAPAAAQHGVCGIFAFPIGAGAARIGALSVYRRQPGPLGGDQLLDALVYADAVFVLALDDRHGLSADLDQVIDAAFTARRAEVHQAAGLVAAQQRISVTDALALLRAHAFSSGRPLHRVATEVMAGHRYLDGDHQGVIADGSDGRGDPPGRDPDPPGSDGPDKQESEQAENEEEDER
ncbi:ANTAR domain-containing protein [Kribbella capetownensis]|uniref:ANTAR domain-containing protein n=1 Tax=Kribbella capetownensis TaxID=1572659 RepID=A0A4V2M810_9ACTN|nr:GAF and ANTAR domain-containing protein [Kribbella capetownensis]TCC49692.1 ANTAR domain-containing protein [Kribbella capetownensis]